jgi:hypothetical protein
MEWKHSPGVEAGAPSSGLVTRTNDRRIPWSGIMIDNKLDGIDGTNDGGTEAIESLNGE